MSISDMTFQNKNKVHLYKEKSSAQKRLNSFLFFPLTFRVAGNGVVPEKEIPDQLGHKVPENNNTAAAAGIVVGIVPQFVHQHHQ